MCKIIAMTINDYNEMIKLWKNTEGVGTNDYDDTRKGIKKFLQKNPKTCFVAKNTVNEIIGTILGGYDGRRGLIYHLMVKPEYRNNGIGKKLLERVEKIFTKEGIKRIYIIAFRENESGNKFWEGNGYKVRDFLTFRTKIVE